MIEERLPISAYIICRDEIATIGPCIDSLSVCNEIVIVDSGSNDGTLELIEDYRRRGFPVRLFHKDWAGYALQKQFALDQTQEAWCLSLDADERLDDALRAELPSLVSPPDDIAAWRLEFRLSLYAYGYVPEAVRYGASVRLFRRGRASYQTQQFVHESLDVRGEIRTAGRGKILHARALPIGEQIAKENQYSSLKARQLFDGGCRPRPFRLISSPLLYFCKIYFLKRFLLCGWAGFIHAVTGAIYSFLTEAKLHQLHAAADASTSRTPHSQ